MSLQEVVSRRSQTLNSALKSKKGDIMQVSMYIQYMHIQYTHLNIVCSVVPIDYCSSTLEFPNVVSQTLSSMKCVYIIVQSPTISSRCYTMCTSSHMYIQVYIRNNHDVSIWLIETSVTILLEIIYHIYIHTHTCMYTHWSSVTLVSFPDSYNYHMILFTLEDKNGIIGEDYLYVHVYILYVCI